MIRPAEDLALYRAEMAQWREGRAAARLARRQRRRGCEANDACRRDILDRLDRRRAADLAGAPGHLRGAVASSGWNNNRNVTQLLDFMVRAARSRSPGGGGATGCGTWPSRVYPDDPVVPAERGAAHAATSGGCARWASPGRAGAECPVEPVDVGEVGEPAVVEGVRGEWRVDPAQLGQPFAGRAALLSPFDRLIYDRKRMAELFEFDYQLEMYKPAAKRRWGYFALPILYGDRLVGKLDATADRKAGVLRVDAIHEDEPFDDRTDRGRTRRRSRTWPAGWSWTSDFPGEPGWRGFAGARGDPGRPAPVSPAGGQVAGHRGVAARTAGVGRRSASPTALVARRVS